MWRFEEHLRLSLVNRNDRHPRLRDAMAYSLLSGGKRVRPQLVFEAAAAVAKTETNYRLALPAALAVEYVHSYSLIHDDLPSMDNDDYRRGKLSCHVAFDEATAILAGDALQADAFALVANAKLNAAKQCAELANACGSIGMVSGQMADIEADLGLHGSPNWLEINRQKTARLFSCAAVLGGLSVDAGPAEIETLRHFGEALGLAFQFIDDALDGDRRFNTHPHELAKQFTSVALEEAAQLPRGQKLVAFAENLLQRSY